MAVKEEMDDRFKKFGTVSFTAITKTNDFIGHLENGRVMGTRCRDCGLEFFPPRADCYHCFSSHMEWFEVSGAGKLITYSRLQFGPVGFEEDLPYSIAVLDYGSFKVFGRIAAEIPEDEIALGMEMETKVRRLSNDQLSYVFQKA